MMSLLAHFKNKVPALAELRSSSSCDAAWTIQRCFGFSGMQALLAATDWINQFLTVWTQRAHGAGQSNMGGPPMSGFTRELCAPRVELISLGLSANELVPLLVGHSVEEIERELVLHTLRHFEGNRMHSAGVLGVSVRGLRNKISQYAALGIAVPESNQSKRKALIGAE